MLDPFSKQRMSSINGETYHVLYEFDSNPINRLKLL